MKKILLTTAVLSSSLMISSAFAKHVKHYDNNAVYAQATGKTITSFHESPYIKKYMPKLPPVNVRLKGLDPMIEAPSQQIGTYGGQANVLTMAPYSGQDTIGLMPYEMVLGLESDNSTIIAGLASSYKLSKDLKSITFTVRKGLKWSDGVPVTATELYNWNKYVVEGLNMPPIMDDMTFKLVNDRQFTLSVKQANAFLPNVFINWAGNNVFRPFHYIKKYLPQFNKHLKQDALKEGYKDPIMYAKAEINSFKTGFYSLRLRPNVPTLSAYVLTTKANDHWTLTRNPYYWRVDTAGNQLPYIDRISLKLMNSQEVLTAKILAGDVDYSKYNNATSAMTVLKQHEKEGHYKTYVWSLPYASQPVLAFNLSYNGPDKVGAKIIKDIRFRKAFSLMIDRKKINDTLYYGKALPTQMTISTTSKYYKKKYAQSYAQYDPKQANKLLDQMGLKWDKRHKYRVRPDGKPLSLLLLVTATNGASSNINMEMIQTFAQAVGIQFIIKEAEWTKVLAAHVDGNTCLISIGGGNNTTDPIAWPAPTYFVPYSGLDQNNIWSLNYAKWLDSKRYHTKVAGIEPPQYIKDLYNVYLDLMKTTDESKRAVLADKILAYQAKYLFTIGMITNPPKPVTARDNMGNMDLHGFTGADNKWSANYAPELRFFKRPLYKNQIIK